MIEKCPLCESEIENFAHIKTVSHKTKNNGCPFSVSTWSIAEIDFVRIAIAAAEKRGLERAADRALVVLRTFESDAVGTEYDEEFQEAVVGAIVSPEPSAA